MGRDVCAPFAPPTPRGDHGDRNSLGVLGLICIEYLHQPKLILYGVVIFYKRRGSILYWWWWVSGHSLIGSWQFWDTVWGAGSWNQLLFCTKCHHFTPYFPIRFWGRTPELSHEIVKSCDFSKIHIAKPIPMCVYAVQNSQQNCTEDE